MEKSDHYYIHRERMRTAEAPTISEVKQQLGKELSEALFQDCPDVLKPFLGLTPLLKGPGNDLWVSPSDILIGKVCLKPPLTLKYKQALTHQGILAIGHDVEARFWNETELYIKNSLAEQEELTLFIAELEKRKALELAHRKEQEKCRAEKEQLKAEFEGHLKDELKKLTDSLAEHYKILMRCQKEELEREWQFKLEKEVEETVARLNEQFLQDLAKQEEKLLKKFNIEIKKEQIKRNMDVKSVQERCQETFVHLKKQLECKNIANIMYILCMERRKCQSDREHVEGNYQTQIRDLQDQLLEKEVEVTKLTRERDAKITQVNLREECLLEILRQFQKFINFTLRASPTQAEFLLSVEKMMVFELAQAIAQTDSKHAKHLARTLLPWRSESRTTTSSHRSLAVKDFHRCYSETEPPESDRSLKSGDYLPAFHYDKHMYVREDFRNMMSQGIKVSPSNMIWNRDVEHLMQVLRLSSSDLQEEQGEPIKKQKKRAAKKETTETQEKHASIEEPDDKKKSVDTENKSITSKKYTPRRSVVYFKQSEDDTNFLFPIFESQSSISLGTEADLHDNLSVMDKVPSNISVVQKECCIPCALPQSVTQQPDVQTKRKSAVPLIGARNSLELAKQTSELNAPPQPSSNHRESVGILCAQDSLLKHRMSLKPSSKIFHSRESVVAPETIVLRKKSKASSEALTSDDAIMKKASNQTQHPSIEDKLVQKPNSPPYSKDSKKQLRLNDQPEIQQKPGEEDAFDKMSKLSLTRDSYIIHKCSLNLKQNSQLLPKSKASQDTIQLKRQKACDTQERKSLKKQSKFETQSFSLSLAVSNESIQKKDSPIPTSKLTMSKDSLDIIRSHSKTSDLKGGTRKDDSKQSVEIKDEILCFDYHSQISPHAVKADDDGSKTVKISHIEVLPLEDQQAADESIEAEHSEFSATKVATADSPWLVYQAQKEAEPPTPRDDFLTKPNVAHIAGDHAAKEYLQKDTEFTLHRVTSLLGIFRKHPSLTKMFTACSK